MSETAADQPTTPPWTLGWRLQRSLDWANVSVQRMAEELGVSRSTISKWCHDIGAQPRTIYLRAWAHRCRVPYEWLIYGDELPRRDSNSQPAGWAKDRPLTDAEKAVIKSDWRSLIRRGTFGHLADLESSESIIGRI